MPKHHDSSAPRAAARNPVLEGKVYRFGVHGLQETPLDFHVPSIGWEERHALGKAQRKRVPRESHAEWKPPKDRPDPLKLIDRSNQGRLGFLIPLRMGRMAASPFGFLRGTAGVMAWDLAHSPVSGITTIIDGDSHLGNFGFYGTPQHDIVFDLHDFDETAIGAWEWDLKRLVASFNVLGRENGLSRLERSDAVKRCVSGYRENSHRLERMGVLDVWYQHAYPGRLNPLVAIDPKSEAIFKKAVRKAATKTSASLLTKMTQRDRHGRWRFRNDPPILTRVDRETREQVISGLKQYADTLTRDWRYLVSLYHVEDVALRVVGVGSVGTRVYLAMLFGNGDADPLFLQVKEAGDSAWAPYVPTMPAEFAVHKSWRVIWGHRMLQASSDPLLGFTTIGGRDYYVRQMKNLKGGVPFEYLSGEPFSFYAWACGALLARAHGRTGAGASISGYVGNSDVLDEALAQWAEDYGDQNQSDYEALVDAIKSGRVKAIPDT